MSLIKGTLLLWFVNGQAVAGHPVHAALSGAPHRPVVSVALWGARKVPMSSQLMVVAPLAIIIVGLCWRSHHVILSVAFRVSSSSRVTLKRMFIKQSNTKFGALLKLETRNSTKLFSIPSN